MRMFRCIRSEAYPDRLDMTNTADEWLMWAFNQLMQDECLRNTKEVLLLHYIKGDESLLAFIEQYFDLDLEECEVEL